MCLYVQGHTRDRAGQSRAGYCMTHPRSSDTHMTPATTTVFEGIRRIYPCPFSLHQSEMAPIRLLNTAPQLHSHILLTRHLAVPFYFVHVQQQACPALPCPALPYPGVQANKRASMRYNPAACASTLLLLPTTRPLLSCHPATSRTQQHHHHHHHSHQPANSHLPPPPTSQPVHLASPSSGGAQSPPKHPNKEWW